MGTNGMLCVAKYGVYKVAQYNQFDSYPDGLGRKVLEFCENIQDQSRWFSFNRKVSELTSVSVDEYRLLRENDNWPQTHPQFHRTFAMNLLDHIMASDSFGLFLQPDFIDSGDCEFCYTLNLDTEMLVVNWYDIKSGMIIPIKTAVADRDVERLNEAIYGKDGSE